MIEDKAIHKHGITENGSHVFSMADIQIEPMMTSSEQFSQSAQIQIDSISTCCTSQQCNCMILYATSSGSIKS